MRHRRKERRRGLVLNPPDTPYPNHNLTPYPNHNLTLSVTVECSTVPVGVM